MDDKKNTKMENESNKASQESEIKDKDAEKQKDPAEDHNKKGDGDGTWFKQLPHIFDARKYKEHLASSNVSIYKVPESIRFVKEEAFKPQVVSFGPISRGKDKQHGKDKQLGRDKQPCPMDHYKLDAVNRTLQRLNCIKMHSGEDIWKINDLVTEVKKLKEYIRDCYEGRATEWDDQSLAWMITMDACFILEFLRSCHGNNGGFSLVFNSADNAFANAIRMDILKLENQIPLRIIKRILELEGKNVADYLATLLEHHKFFKGFPFDDSWSCKEEIEGACHLLDLCSKVITGYLTKGNTNQISASDTGNCCGVTVKIALSARCDTNQKSASDTGNRRRGNFESIRSAEKLEKAGIKFKACKERVYFEGSTFFLHSISVTDETEILLRNLMIFEQCQECKQPPNKAICPECKPRSHPTIISDYIMLMEGLIDSKQDVALLEKEKIIRRFTGSDKEIVTIFDTLSKGITASEKNPFNTVREEVESHCNKRRNRWKYEFKETYCSKPWIIASLLTATVLGSVAILQAVINTLKYNRK